MSQLKCSNNCPTEFQPGQTTCSFCGEPLIEPKPKKGKTNIVTSVASIVILIAAVILQATGTVDFLGTSGRTASFETITVPAADYDSLPELPTEATFEDFIGEFPEAFYFTINRGDAGILTIAEANSVTYFRTLTDGTTREIIVTDDDSVVRDGGRGSFSPVDTRRSDVERLMDLTAGVIRTVQFQYTFTRDMFDQAEITILGFDTIAGRDVIVYKITNASGGNLVYLDVHTKLCLKLSVYGGETVFEFDVFKTSGFSFPN